jgi:hypothetical protein
VAVRGPPTTVPRTGEAAAGPVGVRDGSLGDLVADALRSRDARGVAPGEDVRGAVARALLWTLTGAGLTRWVHGRTVSKFLGADPAVRPCACGWWVVAGVRCRSVWGSRSGALARQVLVEAEQVEVVDGARVDGLLQGSALEQALHGNLDALSGEGVRDAGDLDDLVGDVAG